MASMQEGEKQGILVEIAEKIVQRASLEPSEDIWMAYMAIVKGIRVKELTTLHEVEHDSDNYQGQSL